MVSSAPTTTLSVSTCPVREAGTFKIGPGAGLASPVDVAFVREASRVEQARRIGTAWLRHVCRMPTAQVDSAEVVISELVSNAIIHGHGTTIGFRIRHRADGQVGLEINDHSPSATPEPRKATPDAESGRGLWLVDALVAELGGTWGFSADGTVAWCVFPLLGA
ncbi:ATP-binding protein [Streptomyces sp. NPDC051677]|uniref:ATP-binding protein n=1 Tax=Streptomyces sp. NPDC051677 TaxID=3365669 RepID=UPI0037D61E57